MKSRAACLITIAALCSGCGKKAEEVTITETRALTTQDQPPKLRASSDERFRDAQPSPVKAQTPEGWRTVPPTQFRHLNYRFGPSGLGECWVTLAAGTVDDNINRWLAQFGQAPLSDAEVRALRSVEILGTTGSWVEAEGEYASGMGAPPRPDFALAGIVALIGDQILTIKMVGPKDEVETAKAALESFAGTVTLAE